VRLYRGSGAVKGSKIYHAPLSCWCLIARHPGRSWTVTRFLVRGMPWICPRSTLEKLFFCGSLVRRRRPVICAERGWRRRARCNLQRRISCQLCSRCVQQLTFIARRSSSTSATRAALMSGAAGKPTYFATPERIETSRLYAA
jgi:hypothetical protein